MPAEGALRNGTSPDFQLIETMRWEPAEGFVRFDRHLARLYASASALGFSYDPQRVGDVLKNAVADPTVALRARLVLSANGDATASTQPFEPVPVGRAWMLKFADVRLDSADPLLRHKTSHRETYGRARSEFPPHEADEVILLNERREVCEGTITNVFIDTGDGEPFLTPPLSCGLLPGVLRAEMIEQGRAVEAVLAPHDLGEAHAVFVGNSFRGLIPARLA